MKWYAVIALALLAGCGGPTYSDSGAIICNRETGVWSVQNQDNVKDIEVGGSSFYLTWKIKNDTEFQAVSSQTNITRIDNDNAGLMINLGERTTILCLNGDVIFFSEK